MQLFSRDPFECPTSSLRSMSGERISYARSCRAAALVALNLCHGELLLKRIEPANRTLELDSQIFVCANCGREEVYLVSYDHSTPHPKVA